MSETARRLLLVGTVSVGGLLALAATAYACSPLADIDVRADSGVVGQTLDGTGDSFSPVNGPVKVHFNSLRGQVVWSGNPDLSGSFDFTFQVPEVAPGYYTIIASQASTTGRTMVRDSLAVVATDSPEKRANSEGPLTGPGAGDRPPAAPSLSAEAAPSLSAEKAPSVSEDAPPATTGSIDLPLGARPTAQMAERRERVSEGTAVADLYAGYSAGAAPSLGPFPTSPGEGGPLLPWSLGLAVLGLGLVLLSGGTLLLLLARRKVAAEHDLRSI